MLTSTLSRPFLATACLLLSLAPACHDVAHDNSSNPAPSATAAAKHDVVTHVLAAEDNRHVVHMSVGDKLAVPADSSYEWRVNLEDATAFKRVNADAGPITYEIMKGGPLRVMVFSDPTCLKADGGCTRSKRRWDVTFDVR